MMITDPVSGISYEFCLYRQKRQIRYEVNLAWGVKAVQPRHIGLLIGAQAFQAVPRLHAIAVVAALLHKAVGDRLTCVFVDNGLLRKGEREYVEALYKRNFKIDLRVVDGADGDGDGVADAPTKIAKGGRSR